MRASHENRIVKTRARSRTIVFNKSYDVPCFTDSDGLPTPRDYIPIPDVYAAGRFDRDSEGLLLTSDGSLAHYITDPRHHLPKVYLDQVERIPDASVMERLRSGMVVSGIRTKPALARLLIEQPTLPERPVRSDFERTFPPLGWNSRYSKG